MRSGTLRAASWKEVRPVDANKNPNPLNKSSFLAEKLDFGSHFGSPVDSEGGPKITFLVIMLKKNEKNPDEKKTEKTNKQTKHKIKKRKQMEKTNNETNNKKTNKKMEKKQ